ncbi:MAG: ribbon-helix-helix protein, CopG family [Candidatus Hodarchaeales archaeon]|jgi:Arc/MetJ-type ribon-helix-helix transcriptional regulator
MANISVRIDEKMKKEMEQMRQVNWSEIIREAIRDRLNQEKQKNLAKAVLINERIRKKAPIGYDSTDIIRVWREIRS